MRLNGLSIYCNWIEQHKTSVRTKEEGLILHCEDLLDITLCCLQGFIISASLMLPQSGKCVKSFILEATL